MEQDPGQVKLENQYPNYEGITKETQSKKKYMDGRLFLLGQNILDASSRIETFISVALTYLGISNEEIGELRKSAGEDFDLTRLLEIEKKPFKLEKIGRENIGQLSGDHLMQRIQDPHSVCIYHGKARNYLILGYDITSIHPYEAYQNLESIEE